MLLYLNIVMLLLLQTAQSSPVPLTTPSRRCPTCTPAKSTQSQQQQQQPLVGDLNSTASLTVGEPCGVYKLSCAPGLRCEPRVGEPRPLRALLEGRGVCTNVSAVGQTQDALAADPAPTEDPNEPPCRRLLTNLIKGLNAHLFNSHYDIYMPNCDKRGFFRKKQCWSARGKQPGKCWCVDQNGMPVTSKAKQKGGLSC